MKDLYIYAYPGQMLTFQTVTPSGKIMTNENCDFVETVRTTAKYLKEDNIERVVVVGGTVFADKVAEIISKNLGVSNVERI